MKYLLVILTISRVLCQGQIIIQSGLTHRIQVPPGSEETVSISLKNTSDEPMVCTLHLSDLISTCDSGYRYLPPGSIEESCAFWMTLEKSEIILPPNSEKVVKVLFQSDRNFLLASSRACVLVNSRPIEERFSKSALNVKVRYAINFLYRNPIVPGVVALHAQNIEYHKENTYWTLKIQNQGNVDRIISSTAKILDGRGHVVYSARSLSPRGFIPNQCRSIRFPKPNIPPGKYHMVVLNETDEGEHFGVTKFIEWDE